MPTEKKPRNRATMLGLCGASDISAGYFVRHNW
jgi:hypothetical protein